MQLRVSGGEQIIPFDQLLLKIGFVFIRSEIAERYQFPSHGLFWLYKFNEQIFKKKSCDTIHIIWGILVPF